MADNAGLSAALDGIPMVADAAAREARFPLATRKQNQRVFRLDTGVTERWSGSLWIRDGEGTRGPVFSPRAYGDVDSATASVVYAAVLAAAQAAQAAQGVLEFEAGKTYTMSQGVTLTAVSGLTIRGNGATLTLSGNAASDAAGRLLQFATSVTDLVIDGLGIDGNAAVQTVSEQRAGIFLQNADNVVIRSCTITNTMGDGIQVNADGVGTPCQRVRLLGNCITNVKRHSISFVDIDGAVVAYNECDGAQQGGIHLEADVSTQYLKNVAITGNRTKNIGQRLVSNQDVGISVSGVLGASFAASKSSGIAITGNDCDGQGILVFNSWSPSITGNVIRGAAGTGADGIGIQVSGPSAVVSGNTVIAPTQIGIQLRYAGDGGSGTYGLSAPACTGNTIRELPTSGTAYGIFGTGLIRAVIAENTIVNTTSSAAGMGIRLLGSGSGTKCSRNLVRGNSIHNLAYGLFEDAFTEYTRYEGNQLGTMGTAKFNVSGVSPTITQPESIVPIFSGYTTTPTADASEGLTHQITVTNGTAFQIQAPNNAFAGNLITYWIYNNSGGVMGAVTFAAAYRTTGAFTVPANTKVRTISFVYDGTSWFETGRSTADL